jgi:hypothetical protein
MVFILQLREAAGIREKRQGYEECTWMKKKKFNLILGKLYAFGHKELS